MKKAEKTIIFSEDYYICSIELVKSSKDIGRHPTFMI